MNTKGVQISPELLPKSVQTSAHIDCKTNKSNIRQVYSGRSGSRPHPHPHPAARGGGAGGRLHGSASRARRHSSRRPQVAGAAAAAKDSAAERGTVRRPTPRRWRATARPTPMGLAVWCELRSRGRSVATDPF